MTERLFQQYRAGIRRMLALLGKEHPHTSEALVLQHRLLQNLTDTETAGASSALETGRARILESCNRFCLAFLEESFYILCGLPDAARTDSGIVPGEVQKRPEVDVYFDEINAMLQKEEIHTQRAKTETQNLAREKTLALLKTLDGVQKGHVVQFLYEAGLITEGPGVLFLSGADLQEVNLEGALLIEAHLAGTDMRAAHLDATHLEWARLGETRLEGASLRRTFLVAAHLAQAQLQDAHLEEARLLGANLSGANLSAAHLENAQMQWASLLTANLQGANLRGACLIGVELLSANLSRADLCDADLEYAHLSWARLRGAKYNAQTRWPSDFDPVAAGALKVED